jgi:hypothetical protein
MNDFTLFTFKLYTFYTCLISVKVQKNNNIISINTLRSEYHYKKFNCLING